MNMAISIETVVAFVLYLIVVALVFGLLFWLLTYCESQFPNAMPFFKVGRIVLVILAVFVLIGIILGLAGHPIVRFSAAPHSTPPLIAAEKGNFTKDLLLQTSTW
jgi:hypothetical protein